jgi:hypothetical protein
MPCRTVAQDRSSDPTHAKKDGANSKSSSATTAPASTATPTSTINDPLELKLVGTWRGPFDKEVIFSEDGTYEDLGADIFIRDPNEDKKEGKTDGKSDGKLRPLDRQRGQGDWRIMDDCLHISQDNASDLWRTKRQPHSRPIAIPRPSCYFRIVKLDDSCLRLGYTGGGGITLFFHRVNERPIAERFAAVPAELQPFFATAQFAPEDATALLDLLNEQKINPKLLETVANVQLAWRRKISLQELFGMSEAEVTAVCELLRQSGRPSEEYLSILASSGQLERAELSAFEKVKLVSSACGRLAKNLQIDRQTYSALRVRQVGPVSVDAPPSSAELLSADQRASVVKLIPLLEDLYQWLRHTIYAVPNS